MNKLKPEDVMRALECCCEDGARCVECPYPKNGIQNCTQVNRDALALLREKDEALEDAYDYIRRLEAGKKSRNEEIAEYQKKIEQLQIATTKKDAEIERLKHSKSVAQVNIIDEIANRMRIKEFNSHEIATGYSWAINDLLKLLLELKKKAMRGNKDDQV